MKHQELISRMSLEEKCYLLSVETGEYEILIGSSVAEIHLSETVDVAGTGAPLPYNMSKLPHYASGEIKNIPDQELVLCSIVNA